MFARFFSLHAILLLKARISSPTFDHFRRRGWALEGVNVMIKTKRKIIIDCDPGVDDAFA